MKPLFIIGYMGCGKTTFGKALADYCGKRFVDLDDYVEFREGMTIKEIFSLKGENYFRDMEKACLEELSGEDDIVIACGGGTPCFHDNMQLMNEAGVTLWLQASEERLFSRLIVSLSERPLLTGMDEEGLRLKISSQLEQRRQNYEKAQIRWSGERLENEEEIFATVKDFIQSKRCLGLAITK